MSRSRAIAVAGLCCILAGGCAAQVTASERPALSAAPLRIDTYVVRPGDTLYSIAWRHDVDYRELATWNALGADYKLIVGQVLVLKPRGDALPTPHGAHTAPHAVAAAAAPPAAASSAATARWVWPTDRLSAPRPVPSGGILLLGKYGQDVRAAGSGRVVYTGSGLRGYGNLIIIKHEDSLLSSYAHNQELLVHEGEDVVMGQVIAHMGKGPHQIAALYFEIRLNGKPTDPLRYLAIR